jgi:membrane protease YdiL (CAAX protease family)
MRRSVLLWLLVALAAGFLAGEAARPFLVVGLHNPFWAIWPYAGVAGAAVSAGVFVLLTAPSWLRDSGRAAVPRPIRFGPWQAVWLVAGFILMEFAGLLGFRLVLNMVRIAAMAVTGRPPLFDAAGPGADIFATLAGSLNAAAWSIWYIARRGAARLHDAGPAGIAWRRSPGKGYAFAVLAAFLIILVVLTLFHFLPPDTARLQNLPDAELYAAPGWPAAGIFLLVVFIAPPVEEFVFRGGVFAALATRFSPLTAGIVTTLVFVAVHAPEKIYYPPGFIDVGLMAAVAAWMRVEFGSIRPGILLHVLYNAGLLVAVGFAG